MLRLRHLTKDPAAQAAIKHQQKLLSGAIARERATYIRYKVRKLAAHLVAVQVESHASAAALFGQQQRQTAHARACTFSDFTTNSTRCCCHSEDAGAGERQTGTNQAQGCLTAQCAEPPQGCNPVGVRPDRVADAGAAVPGLQDNGCLTSRDSPAVGGQRRVLEHACSGWAQQWVGKAGCWNMPAVGDGCSGSAIPHIV